MTLVMFTYFSKEKRDSFSVHSICSMLAFIRKREIRVCIRHPNLGYDEKAKIGQAAQHSTSPN